MWHVHCGFRNQPVTVLCWVVEECPTRMSYCHYLFIRFFFCALYVGCKWESNSNESLPAQPLFLPTISIIIWVYSISKVFSYVFLSLNFGRTSQSSFINHKISRNKKKIQKIRPKFKRSHLPTKIFYFDSTHNQIYQK